MSGRSTEPRQCGSCQHWDDGECMAIARQPLPIWVGRKKEWMHRIDGVDCEMFKYGTFQRADLPVPKPERAAKPGRRRRRA
jgi:hypothetical protein